jgi:hypothetical protein
VETGDVRTDASVIGEMLGFIESQGALTVIISDGIMGCPQAGHRLRRRVVPKSRLRLLAWARSLYGQADLIQVGGAK